MSRIHFVGGEKGGVGKSVFARLLCSWLIDQQREVAALDADPVQGALLLSYPDCGHAVDLSQFESADRIMDRALGAEREVVVDLPAHSHRTLLRWLTEGDVFSLAQETGTEVVFWLVTDGGYDSVTTIDTLVRDLDPRGELVLIRNHRWAADFSSLADLEALQRIDEAHTLDLPKLDPRAMYQMQEYGLSYKSALDPSLTDEQRGLSVMERRRTELWLQDCYRRLEALSLGTKTTREPVSQQLPHPQPLAPGTKKIDGARTWTEVGDTYQIHHVRYP